MPAEFISAMVLGEGLGAGLDLNFTELIIFHTPDLDLDAHFCSTLISTASGFRFLLAHLPHPSILYSTSPCKEFITLP